MTGVGAELRLGTPKLEVQVTGRRLPELVRGLTAAGWQVLVQGRKYLRSGAFKPRVRGSGTDWFEVGASCDFDGREVPFPSLLAALKRKDGLVELGGGEVGVLPDDWRRRLEALVGMADGRSDGNLRFGSGRASVLEALLAGRDAGGEGLDEDAAFAEARRRLEGFRGVQPVSPPESFIGDLRPYQREGLGWLHFLRGLGLGGVLADDMGLGKTVQVLALLEFCRLARATAVAGGGTDPGPCIVVMPRSLLFNWMRESARFAPQMRVAIHDGPDRAKTAQEVRDLAMGADLVLVTYAILLRDAEMFAGIPFDQAVVDEAQNIKNAAAGVAKAVRLLAARHRLALTGTPVENRLEDLTSLFEFLSPGLLGRAGSVKTVSKAASKTASKAAASPAPDAEEGGAGAGKVSGDDLHMAQVLARAVRPFVLRRTKASVLKDLPGKIEQTLCCAMAAPQRKLYDELRLHYRTKLLEGAGDGGYSEQRKFVALEALLRLRQAACHPALIDPKYAAAGSAKMDLLIEKLVEVRDEGHRALVFSQFTGMLDLVEPELEKADIPFLRLDGSTAPQERALRVAKFQEADGPPVFLLSLKAGGVGLNLTAASHAFILDPWWNPAAEAQAVDRAHRIGQKRTVHAVRLVAEGTVEERVLELQARKRSLADAILGGDTLGGGLLADLTREDLSELLG